MNIKTINQLEEANNINGFYGICSDENGNAKKYSLDKISGGELTSPFEKGDAENSAVLKGGENQTISEYSVALGKNNVAGLKGYYWKCIDFENKKIYLTITQPLTWDALIDANTITNDNIETNITCEYVVGDIISFVNAAKYYDCSKITNIENGIITVDVLPFTAYADPESTSFDDFSICCLNKPTIGLCDLGKFSVVNGCDNQALFFGAYSEGAGNKSLGHFAHTEGELNVAYYSAHAEGWANIAKGMNSHAEGKETQANGDRSHSEGYKTIANGNYSHAEGQKNVADGGSSHVEGSNNSTIGANSHAEGSYTIAYGTSSHSEGYQTIAGSSITNEDGTITYGGNFSHAEGNGTKAEGINSHAEGNGTTASGDSSHAEGNGTKAEGINSHAEGNGTTASGDSSHAEGNGTKAEGINSHAEGNKSYSLGPHSHAEGNETRTEGSCAHAEGYKTQALSKFSHAEGNNTISKNEAEHASGKFNKSVQSSDASQATQFSIGIGTSDTKRKNAFEVKQNGDIYIWINNQQYKLQDLLSTLLPQTTDGEENPTI